MSYEETDYDSNYEIKEQDRWLPIANIDRVMRNSLPEKAKISKEARQCIQECVSEFIAFITSQAAEKCLIEKRKTLNGEDILYSLYSLGFENYAEILRIYLAKYRVFELDEVERRRKKYLLRKEKLQKERLLKKNNLSISDNNLSVANNKDMDLNDSSNVLDTSIKDSEFTDTNDFWNFDSSKSSENSSGISDLDTNMFEQ